MVLRVLIFIFLFGTNSYKKHLDENNFSHPYGNFFESAVLKVTWLQLCLKFFLSNYEAHWQRHLRDTLQLTILTEMDQHTCKSIMHQHTSKTYVHQNSFLVKHHETKIDRGAWKSMSYRKIQAFTLKSIAPKLNMTFHLLLHAYFTFKQT